MEILDLKNEIVCGFVVVKWLLRLSRQIEVLVWGLLSSIQLVQFFSMFKVYLEKL